MQQQKTDTKLFKYPGLKNEIKKLTSNDNPLFKNSIKFAKVNKNKLLSYIIN